MGLRGGHNRPLARALTLGALAFASVMAGASETFRGALAEARWELESSVFECRLAHPISHFGAAVFVRRAGEEQRFVLRQVNRQLAEGQARVRAEHPPWRATPAPESLGEVAVSTGRRALDLDWRESQRLAAELRTGRRVVFRQRAWDEREQPVEVVVEPVGFAQGFDAFNDCLADLLPVNFEQVRRTALYYPAGNRELPEQARQKLARVARYVLADDRVERVYIDGHTDGVGLRAENLELSRERAEMVTDYLVDRGIDRDRIVTRWHGERYPVASNRSEQGRAENRRVTLRLEREQDRVSASEP